MEELLLDLVYSSGLHLANNSRATSKLWIQINKDIFMNSEFIAFKEEHYREDDYRSVLFAYTRAALMPQSRVCGAECDAVQQ